MSILIGGINLPFPVIGGKNGIVLPTWILVHLPYPAILPRFYPHFTQILLTFYPDFTRILPRFYPHFTQILPRLYQHDASTKSTFITSPGPQLDGSDPAFNPGSFPDRGHLVELMQRRQKVRKLWFINFLVGFDEHLFLSFLGLW